MTTGNPGDAGKPPTTAGGHPPTERPTSRRRFLARSSAAALAAALAGCGGVTALPVTPRNGVVPIGLRDHPELLGPGGWLKIVPAGLDHPVYVLALGDGSYAATSPVCTHQGCTVDIAGASLVCPCHGSMYRRSGEVLRGPAQRALTRYDLRREGDTLLIRIP